MGDGRTDPPVTGADLYGGSGRPLGSDIVQGGLGDCYLVSTLKQYAERQPGVITDAIRYDAKHQRFSVTLHDAAGRTKTMTVMQADLRADRSFGAGGGVDGPAYWPRAHADGSRPPAWPIVMEVAYAKLNAGSTRGTAAELAGLNGGWPRDAIHALTGRADTRVVSAAELGDPAKAYALLETSIRENRAVLLATNPMKDRPTDGLVKGEYYGPDNPRNSGHSYTVGAVDKDKSGNVALTLRNPWGNNIFALQGVNSPDPIVRVDLETILKNGHLENVTVGPGLVQAPSASQAGHRGRATKQEFSPWSATMEVASRSTSQPDTASDPVRAYWSDLRAKGSELTKTAEGAARTSNAGLGRERARTP